MSGVQALFNKFKYRVRKNLCACSRLNKKNRTNILFVGSRFHNIIIGLSKKYNCIVLNPNWKISYFRDYIIHRVKLCVRDDFQLQDFYEYGENGIKSYNSDKSISYAREQVKNLLIQNKIKFIILPEDLLPNNKIIVEEAYKLGILTTTYMHGAYSVIKENPFGMNSVYYWVWGNYYRDRVADVYNRDKEMIFVAGYPDELSNINKNPKSSILFIGKGYTNWRYSDKIKPYASIVKRIALLCERKGIQFTYRPHPSENIKEVKQRFKDVPSIKISNNKKLIKDFSENKVIVGGFSTAIVEATFYSRIVFEIEWDQNAGNREKEYYVKNHYGSVEKLLNLINDDIIFTLEPNSCEEYLVSRSKNISDRIDKEIERRLKEISIVKNVNSSIRTTGG